MSHILLTGSSGQLGQSIRKLADQYPDLSFHFSNKDELNITDSEALKKFFAENRFDYCINCAAYTNVEQAEITPEIAYDVNESGVANLAKACKANRVILLHISTDYVFDGLKKEGYGAEDEPNPINEYGRSKWEGEKRIQEILDTYFIIRTSWLYSNTGSNFYTKIVEKAKEHKVIYITSVQRGCPTHADHLSQYILDLISQKKNTYGIHHYTDGEPMTWYEFAKRILLEQGFAERVTVEESENYRTSVKRPKNSVLLN